MPRIHGSSHEGHKKINVGVLFRGQLGNNCTGDFTNEPNVRAATSLKNTLGSIYLLADFKMLSLEGDVVQSGIKSSGVKTKISTKLRPAVSVMLKSPPL